MKRHRPIAYLTVLFLCVSGGSSNAGTYQERLQYRHALHALNIGRVTEFRNLKDQLQDYPLQPYLQYYDERRNLSRIKPERLAELREQLSDTVLGERLFRSWLKIQARQGRWRDYVEQYERSSDAVAECHFLRGLILTGDRERAFELTPELWLVGVSQPKECDPVFAAWIANGNVSPQLAWQRLKLALDTNSYQLARYLFRFFPTEQRRQAQLLYNIHRQPELVASSSVLRDDPWGHETLLHGLLRLALQEPERANELWRTYKDQVRIAAALVAEFEDELAFWRTRHGFIPETVEPTYSTRTLARIADACISQRRWTDALAWTEALPDAARQDAKWRYWRGIAERMIDPTRGSELLTQLANRRSYYGFLAAQELGVRPELNHAQNEDASNKGGQHFKDPRVERILELFAVGQETDGRAEWAHLSSTLSTSEKRVVLQDLSRVGLTFNGVLMSTDPDVNDVIDVRFPVVFEHEFRGLSHATDVPVEFLLAIARQESAFNPSARSSAGARGVMQLMLGTARRTANNLRINRPSSSDLLDFRINIELGSHHVAELMQQYDGNRVFVAAAYNAGAHRVTEWQELHSNVDIRSWIELIPFYETRDFVKKVLAGHQIYALRLETNAPMLYSHELIETSAPEP